jgi:hypothetical protein
MAWFAMDAEAFLDDPRMQGLTNREKGAWALMLLRSFRNAGMMICDYQVVAEQSGMTKKEAESMILKLFLTGLLQQTPDGEKVFDGISPRMAKEYAIAKDSYDSHSDRGKKSAAKHGTGNLKLVK